MTEQIHDTKASLSRALSGAASSLTGETTSVRELLALIGEQGMLMLCIFLTIPFLVPVSIPGVSTVFGLLVILIGVGVATNRVPWLPNRLIDRRFPTGKLCPALEQGAKILQRLERFLHPRWEVLTRSTAMNRFNGAMIVLAGLLLMAPFGLIPFSNTLPALAALFLAAGMLERDGLFVFVGYLWIVATIVYFGVLIAGAVAAGVGLHRVFNPALLF
ncbi:MAG: exopolysaccharide biosynthesis protein [Acidobacteriota bacterium]|nr:exopolysaccharide biosynthesis protein [Acidobacteriota bacterium]MDQ5872815.1 exopolysaccharide biosynthesis protein [Acidobacteriota bacterium]